MHRASTYYLESCFCLLRCFWLSSGLPKLLTAHSQLRAFRSLSFLVVTHTTSRSRRTLATGSMQRREDHVDSRVDARCMVETHMRTDRAWTTVREILTRAKQVRMGAASSCFASLLVVSSIVSCLVLSSSIPSVVMSSAAIAGSSSAVDEWSSIRPLMARRGPWCTGEFQPEEEDPIDIVQNSVSREGMHATITRPVSLS
jgi:hypothetical protein